jgi:hypothetical protein
MIDPLSSRRFVMGAAKRYLLDALERRPEKEPAVDEMYREAFERAKTTGDEAQMASLDFAYRREQLYFEILLDVRDAIEKKY